MWKYKTQTEIHYIHYRLIYKAQCNLLSVCVHSLKELVHDCAATRRQCFEHITHILSSTNAKKIIGVDRKGYWIIWDYLIEMGLTKKYQLISSLSPLDSIDKDVLIFDDSIKRGATITKILKKLGATCRITIGCIFANNDPKCNPLDSIKSDERIVNLCQK